MFGSEHKRLFLKLIGIPQQALFIGDAGVGLLNDRILVATGRFQVSDPCSELALCRR